jgi:hypothetical protein
MLRRASQYVVITVAAMGSMLAGASVVHQIYKPDITIVPVPPKK